MNKGKLIVRIISGLLVLIMVLGLIIPYVYATEIEDGSENVGTEENIPEDDQSENIFPEYNLPDGFEYIEVDGGWDIKKTSDDGVSALWITRPLTFDTNTVTVFVCNLETEEVKYYDFHKSFNYIGSMYLEDGYYVLYANEFAWADANGLAHSFNGGEYFYFYVGNNYDDEKYNVEFYHDGGIMHVPMIEEAPADYQIVEYQSTLTIDDSVLKCPEDAMLTPIEKLDPDENWTEPTIDDTTLPPEEPIVPTEDDGGVLDVVKELFVGFFDGSILLILAIVVCYIWLTFIKIKKKKAAEKQIENDSYDDRRIE
jgi:hypothetical protein